MLFTNEQNILFNFVYKPELTLEKNKDIELHFMESTNEYLSCVNQENKRALKVIEHTTNRPIIDNYTFCNYLDPNIRCLLSV